MHPQAIKIGLDFIEEDKQNYLSKQKKYKLRDISSFLSHLEERERDLVHKACCQFGVGPSTFYKCLLQSILNSLSTSNLFFPLFKFLYL